MTHLHPLQLNKHIAYNNQQVPQKVTTEVDLVFSIYTIERKCGQQCKVH